MRCLADDLNLLVLSEHEKIWGKTNTKYRQAEHISSLLYVDGPQSEVLELSRHHAILVSGSMKDLEIFKK